MLKVTDIDNHNGDCPKEELQINGCTAIYISYCSNYIKHYSLWLYRTTTCLSCLCQGVRDVLRRKFCQ